MPARQFSPGVFVPLICPFTKNGEVDVPALTAQAVRVAKAGAGLVIHGTNGEACHLEPEERVLIISETRKALDGANLKDVPLLVGTGGQSARESIKLAKEAKEAGADFSIVIHPCYFAFAMGRDTQAIYDFFIEVADASPLPVMIYNFPGAAAGIDLTSDLIIKLSEHQNIVGVKLTCAGIGKGHRIARHVRSAEYKKRHPTPFLVMPGFADYCAPAMLTGQHGMITGTGNVIPKTMVKLYELTKKAIESGSKADWDAALEVQDVVAEADWVMVKAGIAGTKYALDKYCSESGPKLGGLVRSPLPQISDASRKIVDEGMVEALKYEAGL